MAAALTYLLGGSRPLQKKSRSNCEAIAVSRDMTVKQCIELALSRFGFNEGDFSSFVMTTVLVDKAITDRKLGLDEHPFDLMQAAAKVNNPSFTRPHHLYMVHSMHTHSDV